MSGRENKLGGRFPLAVALGKIYTNKATGTLKVLEGSGDFPAFVFWFKRGFPCFSYSRHQVGLLGDQFDGKKKKLINKFVRKARKRPAAEGKLLGQLLLGESLVGMEELERALEAQIAGRLMACAAMTHARLKFLDGMAEFGVVPLSSPLLNPLGVAAKAAAAGSLKQFSDYVISRASGPMVRMVEGRRIPNPLRRQLSEGLISSLVEEQSVERTLQSPTRARTLAFLMAFGYVEFVEKQRVTPKPASPPAIEEVDLLSYLVGLQRRDAGFYELLGLPMDASPSLVKSRYREIAFEIHPDRVPADLAAASREVFAQLVEGYHTLSKERLRTAYDRTVVLSGKWENIGDIRTVVPQLERRRELLSRLRLDDLAMEYSRMIATLSVGRTAAGTMYRKGDSHRGHN